MAPSTSPVWSPPEPAVDWGRAPLERFYAIHARIYDLTRPFILFGRTAAVQALRLTPGQRVLDVGCGTGWNLPRLRASGALPVGIDCSAPMLQQARARLARLGLTAAVALDPEPYGSHDRYTGCIDGILFSYSLSMIPPYALALSRAMRDLRPGGRIVVVDFLDARGPVGAGLRRSHVFLGPERLDALCRLFPRHEVRVRSTGLWRYFLFVGRR